MEEAREGSTERRADALRVLASFGDAAASAAFLEEGARLKGDGSSLLVEWLRYAGESEDDAIKAAIAASLARRRSSMLGPPPKPVDPEETCLSQGPPPDAALPNTALTALNTALPETAPPEIVPGTPDAAPPNTAAQPHPRHSGTRRRIRQARWRGQRHRT